jgi:hypothetical protein
MKPSKRKAYLYKMMLPLCHWRAPLYQCESYDGGLTWTTPSRVGAS